MQKTFVRAFTKFDTFEGRSSVKTWLYRIALNVCRNEVRGRKMHEELKENVQQTQPKPDALEQILEQERSESLAKGLQRLSWKQKEVIALRIYEEYSFKEIAQITNQSENSAKVNFHHGMRKLKDMFAKKDRGLKK